MTSRILLFLIGTTLASCHVLRTGKPSKYKHHLTREPEVIFGSRFLPQDMAALQPISFYSGQHRYTPGPFVQQGTNLYYKPRFILSPDTRLPLQITNSIDKIPEPPQEICVEEHTPEIPAANAPAPIEITYSEPQVIAEHPTLPPLTIPAQTVLNEDRPTFQPTDVDKQAETLKPLQIPQPNPDSILVGVQSQQIPEIPETPLLSPIPVAELPSSVPEVLPSSELSPIQIPEAPVLPPFFMPSLPTLDAIPVVSEILPGSLEIPENPVLPPFTMPELPGIVVPAATPEISTPVFVPAFPEAVTDDAFTNKPFFIPDAPTLPSLPCIPNVSETITSTDLEPPSPVATPEAPVLPPMVVKPEVTEHHLLPQIPEAPQLPPFTMTDLPTILVEESVPAISVIPTKEIFTPNQDIPNAPVLPPFEMPSPIATPEAPVLPPMVVKPEVTEHHLLPQIPEAPQLPPFTMTDLSTILIEESVPAISAIPTKEDFTPHQDIPNAPVLPPFEMPSPVATPEAPVLPPMVVKPEVTEHHLLPQIPEAPQLPPFTMTDLPTILIEESVPAISAIPTKEDFTPHQDIPNAPVLSPFEMPSPVATPEAPVLTHMVLKPEVTEHHLLPQIPESPQLPPFTMPDLPTVLIEEPLPAVSAVPIQEVSTPPQDIPSAPILPLLEMPALPAVPIAVQIYESAKPALVDIPETPLLHPEVIKDQSLHQLPEVSMPEKPTVTIGEPEVEPHREIPRPPFLPPFEMPSLPALLKPSAPEFKPEHIAAASEFPQPIVIDVTNDSDEKPCERDEKPAAKVASTVYIPEVPFVSSAKEGLSQPTFWAQNIIIERFLPSIVVNNKDDLEKVLLERSNYPVITKPYL